MRFEGKTVLVTGGARGMGRSHCLGFAREGANLIVNDVDRDAPGVDYSLASKTDLDHVIQEVEGIGRKAIGLVADVSKAKEVQNMVEQAIAEFGKIDVLVNNAGVFAVNPLVDATEEQVHKVIDVNLKGSIYCCKYVVPHMAKRKYGKIVNISSCTGLYGEPTMTLYSASKYAILGLTESLAAEVSHFNINVNAVCPGAVFTPMMMGHLKHLAPDQDPKEAFSAFCDFHFFRKEVKPEDVTEAVLFLASEEARMITSQWLGVTCGFEKKTPGPEPYFTVPE